MNKKLDGTVEILSSLLDEPSMEEIKWTDDHLTKPIPSEDSAKVPKIQIIDNGSRCTTAKDVLTNPDISEILLDLFWDTCRLSDESSSYSAVIYEIQRRTLQVNMYFSFVCS